MNEALEKHLIESLTLWITHDWMNRDLCVIKDSVQLRDDFWIHVHISEALGLYSLFSGGWVWTFDIEGMSRFILDVNFCMSVKLDGCHVERGCGSLSPLWDWTWHWCDKHSPSSCWRNWTIGRCLHQTWVVFTLLCGDKGCRSWFEMLCLVSVTLYWAWTTLDTSLRLYSAMWQRANAFGSIRYASESVWDDYWTSMSILDFASYILDV